MSMMEFNILMTHKILLKKRDRNYSGDFVILSSVLLDGFVEFGNHLITNEKGEKVEAKAIIFLKDNCGIDINHEYWMVDQTFPYVRKDMEVLKIDPIDDPRTGLTHHYELFAR